MRVKERETDREERESEGERERERVRERDRERERERMQQFGRRSGELLISEIPSEFLGRDSSQCAASRRRPCCLGPDHAGSPAHHTTCK